MAEFQEVMRQGKRICKSRHECESCPIHKDIITCHDIWYEDDFSFAEFERIIMDWAAEHPEPRYPTWLEWWIEKFPDAEERVAMCNFTQCPRPDDHDHCYECTNSPIPADIAQKLGIKPIEAKE